MSAENYGYIQRYVSITGKGITSPFLGMGVDAVRKLYDIAQSGKITTSESIKLDYEYNCAIVFKGSEILKFLQEYYPEYFGENSPDIILDEFYSVTAIDFS